MAERKMDRQSRLDLLRGELARRELARRQYGDYLELVYGEQWIPTRFSRFLAEELQTFLETESGNAYDILVLETPPQHGKSWTLTEALPSWVMGRKPDTRVILVSYSDESAERFARRNRDKLRAWGPALFGVEPGGVCRAAEFELAGHRGRLISRGVLAGITGHPADLLIIDDPIKNREEADSPVYRNKLWAEWCGSMKSRLAAGAKVILVMTPWHEDDLAARILKTEENAWLLRLPVEAEPTADQPDPLGRKPGEPLCPELGKGEKWLEQFRRSYLNDPGGGQRAWLALYLCRPRAEAGNLVRREWWRFYDTPPACPVQIISVDAAFKGGEQNDFVALTVWGKQGENYFLLECVNRHLDFIGTLAAIREARKHFPAARAVLIEDKANGSAILSVLQREMFCVPVEPRGGKASRVHAVSPAIESGHVFLPQSAPWREAFLDQWCAFPAAPHDDMVDASTQALLYLFHVQTGETVCHAEPAEGAVL
ncbi:MAG: phage terminase large subunit, partial [Oscillibacter sp.]|nr:phage terminase large subunit [Oscillibacter sp.]